MLAYWKGTRLGIKEWFWDIESQQTPEDHSVRKHHQVSDTPNYELKRLNNRALRHHSSWIFYVINPMWEKWIGNFNILLRHFKRHTDGSDNELNWKKMSSEYMFRISISWVFFLSQKWTSKSCEEKIKPSMMWPVFSNLGTSNLPPTGFRFTQFPRKS